MLGVEIRVWKEVDSGWTFSRSAAMEAIKIRAPVPTMFVGTGRAASDRIRRLPGDLRPNSAFACNICYNQQ